MEIIDNVNKTLKEDLTTEIHKGSKVSIAAACFSIYAFAELKKELKNVDELRFIFTSPTFIKEKAKREKREFYIPRQEREKNLFGSEFEVKLRNEMTQKAIAKECAEWIRKKAVFKSNVTNENMMGFINVDDKNYMPLSGFTTVDLGCERGNNAYYMVQKSEAPMSTAYLQLFEQIWNDSSKLQEVTDEVIENITTVYNENSPDYLYFVKLNKQQATMVYQYLIKNDYVTIDGNDNITEQYHMDLENNQLAPLPEHLVAYAEGIHKLIQSVFNDKILDDMIDNGNETKVPSNDLNDNFYKKEFQTLWGYINHKYAYTVSFDSNELIKKAIDAIDAELYVSMLQYTTSISEQKDTLSADAIKSGDSFKGAKSDTTALKHFETSQIKYDLIGKVAEATVLTRRTVAAILKGIRKDKFDMYKNNPEEFISKVTRLIKEQKATMIVDHISYDQLEGKYDSEIFTAEKHTTIDKAFRAEKHIQPYVFTDGNADKSVERKFAEDLDGAAEVCVYAKLPKGFSIPTPVGNYSPDWAIAFNEGMVKHIFFVAETKGTMESMQLRPIEKAKIMCARKLFNEISTDNVVYHDVDSYQSLLNIMNDPSLDKKVCE